MIGNFLQRRKQAARARAFTEGWCWAAGQLLEGKPIEHVLQWADYGQHFDGKNPWDDGIRAACDAWEKKTGEKK